MATLSAEASSSLHPDHSLQDSQPPSSWIAQKDSNGRTYFTDPVSNEWYRDSGTGLQRMDTMEKIFVATQQEAHDKLKELKAVSAESLSAHQQWEMMGFMDFVNEKDPNIAYRMLLSADWRRDDAVAAYLSFRDSANCTPNHKGSTNSSSQSVSAEHLERMSSFDQLEFAERASKIEHFESMTNCADSKVAADCLEAAEWDMDRAVCSFFESDKLDDEFGDEFKAPPAQTLNVSEWTEWTAHHIVQWVGSLETGRFQKYADSLSVQLLEQGVTGSDLKELRERDLVELGVSQFADRRALFKHFLDLRSTKETESAPGFWRMVSIGDEEPDEFCCPISYDLFVDPVIVTVSGQTYERKAIEEYIKTEHQDPITQQKCERTDLVPNRIMKKIVDKWRCK